MSQTHWQVSTFVAVGIAGFLGMRKPHAAVPVADGVAADLRDDDGTRTRFNGETSAWHGRGTRVMAPQIAERIARLQRARTPRAQCVALHELAATGAPEVTGVIAEAAAPGRESGVRICSIRALGALGGEDAVNDLVALTGDSDADVRSASVTALAEAQDESARAALLALARTGEGSLRLDAAVALGEAHCVEATPMLVGAIASAPAADRVRIAVALGASEDPSAYVPLLQLTHDLSAFVRNRAITALGTLGTREAVEGLGGMFERAEADDAGSIAAALAQTGTDDARRILVSAVSGADHVASSAAFDALSGLDGPDVHDLMLRSLNSPQDVRARAAYRYFAAHHDPAARDTLLELVRTGTPEAASRALGVLSVADDDGTRAVLIEASHRGGQVGASALTALAGLPGAHDAARAAALDALRENRGSASAEAVEVLAADPSPEALAALVHEAHSGGMASGSALMALATRGDSASAHALMDIAVHATDSARVNAIGALGETHDPDARALLVRLAGSPSDRDGTALRMAIHAGVPEAPGLIATAMASSDANVRRNALEAALSSGVVLPVDQAERLARDADGSVAAYGARMLAEVAPDRTRELALDEIRSSEPGQRAAAMQFVGSLPDDVGDQIMALAAHDTDDTVLGEAIQMLEERGGRDAQQLLASILTRDGVAQGTRAQAASSLQSLGGEIADQNRAAIDAAIRADLGSDNIE